MKAGTLGYMSESKDSRHRSGNSITFYFIYTAAKLNNCLKVLYSVTVPGTEYRSRGDDKSNVCQ